MDATTGLLYVGDGQYYDPSTGRFLTRNAKPNQSNPYLPFDPTGAMLGPLGVLALVLGNKKKKSRYDVLLFVLVFAAASGMTLAACGNGQSPTPTPGSTVEVTVIPISSNEALVQPYVNGTPAPPFVVTTPTQTPQEILVEICPTIWDPTPLPSTPTPCPVCATNQYAQMMYDAVLKNQNNLPPGFSVALLFALAAVESGGTSEPYRNSTTHGGAFQLRANSGHYHHPYEDSPAGYDQNVKDAIAVINENYGFADGSISEDNPYFYFLYVETYPNNRNEITAARTVLYYNGGFGWIETYKNEPINKPYVGNVSKKLKNYVPTNFGFTDSTLVDILQSVQAVVNAYVP